MLIFAGASTEELLQGKSFLGPEKKNHEHLVSNQTKTRQTSTHLRIQSCKQNKQENNAEMQKQQR
jgi:hypothetical protein